ncbi:MAG: hypothetical protein ACTSW1_12040 [Candidatus Hodarchaeales archaeon]
MNEFLFYTFLILSFVRLLGLGVSVDLFLFNKNSRYKYLIFAWGIWVVSSIFPMILDRIQNNAIVEIFLVVNSELILVGLLFIMSWALSYYKPFSTKLLVYLTCIIVFLPMILYFIGGYSLALNFNSVLFLSLFFLIIISTWRKREELKPIIGNSIRWLYATNTFGLLYILNSFITALQGYSFGVYQTNDAMVIIRYYFFVIGTTLLIVTMIIKWEQSVSEIQKFQMKDVYSHKVGNFLQIILNNLESLNLEDKQEKEILKLTREKCIDAGELIAEIRKI